MKITKRQLRRIIQEEKRRLLSESNPAAPGRSAREDQDLKDYQDGVYGGKYGDLEPKMEDAMWTAVEMYMEVNGVDEAEAKQLVVDHVTEILGITR